FGAEAPEGVAVEMSAIGGAEFVVSGESVEHPDVVDVVVFVFVIIERAERGGIELNGGVGFESANAGGLERERIGDWMGILFCGGGPVIGVIGDAHDDFLRR